VNGFNFSKLVLLSTLIFTYSNASNSQILHYQGFYSGIWRTAWQECAQQTEKSHSHTNFAVSRQVYVHVLLLQHLYSVILAIYGLAWSKIKKSFDAEKAEKLIKMYQFYRAEEDSQ